MRIMNPLYFKRIMTILFFCFLAGNLYGQNRETKPELSKYFQGFQGAFVLYDLNKNHVVCYNPDRCAKNFLPASTFKILNSLIGLETGVIADENFVIPWNGTKYPYPSWNSDQTLKSAIQNSVVWYYQELARRVGEKTMQFWVSKVRYGNADISGKIDSFWLEGGLRISADEQIDFLKRFYQNELPFSRRSVDIVKSILVLEKNELYTLSGKSGSVDRKSPHIGWFVGYVEKSGNVYFFAVNIESPRNDTTGVKAKEIAGEILKSSGLL